MINRKDTASIINPQPPIGVLTDTEMLLVGISQGKRMLHSLLLPTDASELKGLLEYVWETGLTSVWVMPATTLSRNATCAWLEQANHHWTVIVHPNPGEPTRPLCALFWPKGSGRQEGRRLALVFPEHAGWGWTLSDARSLLATVTYLDQVLAWPVSDSPDLVAHQLLTELTRDQPTSWLRSSSVDPRTL